MRLGINLLFLDPGKVGGSETYSVALLDQLDQKFISNSIFVYCTKTFALQHHYSHIILRPLISSSQNKFKRLLFELFVLPFYCLFDRLDLLHSIGYTSPLITPCPKMLTIFDLQYKEVAQTVPFVVRLVYNLLTPLVLISNQSLIAISKFTKQQISKYYPFIDQGKIIVIPLGHSITQKPVPLKSRANYIYTPSASHPHKNLLRLIKAFNLYSQHHPDSSLRLHISGFPGLESKKVNRLIKEYKLEEKIKFLGWLPYTQVINQMSNAKLCVFPTLYEGFGLPALESLAVGTPLIASDLPVLREVIKDNAIFVNPLDINSIETAIKMGITDTKLVNKLVKDGQEIAASFTWDNYAHQVIDIYHKFS